MLHKLEQSIILYPAADLEVSLMYIGSAREPQTAVMIGSLAISLPFDFNAHKPAFLRRMIVQIMRNRSWLLTELCLAYIRLFCLETNR
jgi:hypothetical protein